MGLSTPVRYRYHGDAPKIAERKLMVARLACVLPKTFLIAGIRDK